ncbi:MAG: ABC transporter ATP-binding protein [Thermodesulfobacteriota bacterium]|nr:ABC transporter ATP-binding protein [Thermodesulfobacteriota bacterium]
MAVKLECRSINFRYGKKEILKNISFKVESGNFCAILGRNGSGKTTLLHTLNGINRPFSGNVLINSRETALMSQKNIAQHISLVPQEHIEIFPFKVLDVVVMGRSPFLKITATPGAKEYELALNALKILNAEKLAASNFNTISGGERQIALLAAALAQTSEIMLLDEPTNHLDFNNQYHLLSTIKQLCRTEGLSVIASMHDPNMAMLFADQVIMMKNGEIITDGKAETIMTKTNIDRLYELDTAEIDLSEKKRLFIPANVL